MNCDTGGGDKDVKRTNSEEDVPPPYSRYMADGVSLSDKAKIRVEFPLLALSYYNKKKISALAKSIRTLADMEEPIGQVLKRTEIADGLVLEKSRSPLGALLIVSESRPDALVQIATLAIRSGNGLLLKGGKEARRSNAILHKVITSAIPDKVGEKLIGLITSREEIPNLLKASIIEFL